MHPRSVFTTTFKSEETMLVNTGPVVTNSERCIKPSTGYIQELGGVEFVTLYEALLSTVCVWGLGDASYQAQYWLYPWTGGGGELKLSRSMKHCSVPLCLGTRRWFKLSHVLKVLCEN